MNISLEQLKDLMVKYDLAYGQYPESRWQGSDVYHFILHELGIEYDIREYEKFLPKDEDEYC